jgi:uncharacterized protein YvpB
MGTIRSEKSTLIKRFNLGSDELEKNDFVQFEVGKQLAIASIVDDKNQHAKVKFPTPLFTSGEPMSEGYIYEPHWHIPIEMMPKEIKLDVTYRTQIDNSTNLFGTGYRQCNLTSNAMALDYLLEKSGKKNLDTLAKEGGYREAESVYAQVLKKYGDTIYHDAHTRALQEFGIESYFSTTMSISDLIECLSCRVPVPLGVSYKSSGHIVLCVGYEPIKKFFWIHDPYGCRSGSANCYAMIGGVAGEYDKYSLDVMREVWGDVGNKESGWGRVFTNVKGVETGCPKKL